MSSFFHHKFFSQAQEQRIIDAIKTVEQETSGEIRVFVENKNPLVDPVERASQVFHKLKMENTRQRNAVLLYVAVKHREIAVYADEGIFKITGADYWKHTVNTMIKHFKEGDLVHGITNSILHLGEHLKEKFPCDSKADINELPGEIIFGD